MINHLTTPMAIGVLLAATLFGSPAVAAPATGLGAPPADECVGPLSTPPAPSPTGFAHQAALVDGVQMHYVIGGTGKEAVVLLHGWPESWYEWVAVMPDLARDYTVIAVDLPGLGDSRGQPRGYDKKTLAEYVHTLVATTLGYSQVHIVGHDLGAGVAFAYAAFHPEATTSLTMLDYPLPGPAFDDQSLQHILWHFGLHTTPQLPEQLVTGRQRTYFEWFFTNYVAPGNHIQPAAVTEFVRTYCDSDRLHAGFELYRSLATDTADNLRVVQNPLALPVLDMTARPLPAAVFQPLFATPLRIEVVPDSGHFLPEENPAFVTATLRDFLNAPLAQRVSGP